MLQPDPPDALDRLSLSELRARRSSKWQAFGPEVLPLWVAEMDTLLPAAVVETVSDLIARGDTGYPYGPGYALAFAAFAAERWGWRVDPELVRPVTDVMSGVAEALRVLSRPGDPVVITPPLYHPFFPTLRALDRQPIPAPLGPDGRLDLAAVKAGLAEAARRSPRPVLVLTNPQNPTGVVHSRAELTAVASLAARFRARVVVDEIHAPLTYDEATFTPYLTVPGGDNGFSVISASKAFNLAALKAGLLVAGNGSAVDLARVPDVASHGASALGVAAHTAALAEGGDWLDEHLAALDVRRRLLGRLVADLLPGVGYAMPEATFLAWLDCRELELPGDPAAFFRREARVALNPGPAFGAGGAGHVRLNFATSTAVLTEAVERMATAIARR